MPDLVKINGEARDISIYDNAKHWVAQYDSVDDVKDYIDKAAALEEYARRANDKEMEFQVARARVRAERRCGELLAEMEMSKGDPGPGRGNKNPLPQAEGVLDEPKPKPLKEMGISHNQSSRFQKLAKIPESKFEEEIARPEYALYPGQNETDNLRYKIIAKRRGSHAIGTEQNCTRASFASWAKCEVI